MARQCMASKIRGSYEKFKKDQLIWLEAKYLKLRYNKKISTKQEGPFKITDVLGPVTYGLQFPDHWKMHNVFHASLLSPFKENNIHSKAY